MIRSLMTEFGPTPQKTLGLNIDICLDLEYFLRLLVLSAFHLKELYPWFFKLVNHKSNAPGWDIDGSCWAKLNSDKRIWTVSLVRINGKVLWFRKFRALTPWAKSGIFTLMALHKHNASEWDLDWRRPDKSHEDLWTSNQQMSTSVPFLVLLDSQDSDARNKIIDTFPECSLTLKAFLIETSLKKSDQKQSDISLTIEMRLIFKLSCIFGLIRFKIKEKTPWFFSKKVIQKWNSADWYAIDWNLGKSQSKISITEICCYRRLFLVNSVSDKKSKIHTTLIK